MKERASGAWADRAVSYRMKIVIAAALILLSVAARKALALQPVGILRAMLYVGLLFAWGISVRLRILREDIRRYMMLSVGLMFFLLLMRTIRYEFVLSSGILSRHLWYGYYFPIVFLPLLGLFVASAVGRQEQRLPAGVRYLLIPAVLLTVGVLTNDLHQLAFRFQPGLFDWNHMYERGPLYLLILAWCLGLFLAVLILLFRKCRVRSMRRHLWQLLLLYAGITLYFLLYVLGFERQLTWVLSFPDMLCLMMVIIYEVCIQIGLIPSNSRYAEFFRSSGISAVLMDADGHAVILSENAVALTEEQRESVLMHDSFVLDQRLFRSHPVAGGRMVWVEDVSYLLELHERLEDTVSSLSEENALIEAENAARQQEARLRESRRIYEELYADIRPGMQQIETALETIRPDSPDFEKQLRHLAILGAYVKRRSNLALITAGRRLIASQELDLCFRESLSYLSDYGIAASFADEFSGMMSAETAKRFYDSFERCLEDAMQTLSKLSCRIRSSEDGICMELMLDDTHCMLREDAL